MNIQRLKEIFGGLNLVYLLGGSLLLPLGRDLNFIQQNHLMYPRFLTANRSRDLSTQILSRG